MNCCDHNECCGHSNDRIGAEIGMLHNLLRRQMACMTEKTANAAVFSLVLQAQVMQFSQTNG